MGIINQEEARKAFDLKVSQGALHALEEEVKELIKRACERTRENRRRIVMEWHV